MDRPVINARIDGIFVGRSAPLGTGNVPSAFVKTRVSGAIEAGVSGLTGDEQADLRVHGGPDMAIYAYALSHYRDWTTEFPEHAGLWDAGALGENLAMDGWDETDVCIGDIVQIGQTLLQVTRPRKPCFKLALRFDDLRLPRRLVEAGRCGWYYRVLKSGSIATGDEAILVRRLYPDWSIRRVNDLSIAPDADLADLRELAGLPELAGNWRAQVQAAALAREAVAKQNAFREFTVVGVRDETAQIRSFELAPADGSGIPVAVPGQHLVVRSGQSTSRPYSISAIAATHLQISVKRETGGFSEWLHDSVKAGDRLSVLGPRGSFRLDTSSDAPLVLISAGVGITPVMAMLQAATTNNGARIVPASVSFVHCTRNSDHQAFKASLSDIGTRHPSVRFHTRFSRPLATDRIGVTHDCVGRIDKDLIRKIVAPLGACNVYVCGPLAFMSDVSRWINDIGVPGIRVMTELFGPAAGKTPAAGRPRRPQHSRVVFARSERSLQMNSIGSLLELAEAENVPVNSDCRSGVCGACVAKVISGEVGYEFEPVAALAEGEALLCCGFPLTEDLVLDL